MATMSKKYNEDYWKKNRKVILAQRKKRYLTDPAYRASVIQAAQDSYARRRVGPKAEKAVVVWKGQTMPAYTIIDVSRLLGVSHDSVRRWIRHGKIPAPTCTASAYQWPVYPESQVKALCHELSVYRGTSKHSVFPDDPDLEQRVQKAMADS